MGTKKGPYTSGAEDNKMKMTPATSVDQGKSLADELDWTPSYNKTPFPHDGLSAKIPKK